MSFFFICVVATAFGDRVLAQIGDRETTPAVPPGGTSFTCQGRPPGYYADLETGCKTYHVCDGHSHFTYICPRGTLFQQRMRVCDHSYLVHCEESPRFYEDLPSGPEASENRLAGDEEPADEVADHAEEFSTTTEPTTTTTPTPTTTAEPPTTRENFLRFSLKDFRSLFFIPEVPDNSIGGRVRELVLPLGGSDVMRFKAREEVEGAASGCPRRCDPRFLLPGSCHPCVFIK